MKHGLTVKGVFRAISRQTSTSLGRNFDLNFRQRWSLQTSRYVTVTTTSSTDSETFCWRRPLPVRSTSAATARSNLFESTQVDGPPRRERNGSQGHNPPEDDAGDKAKKARRHAAFKRTEFV